MTHSLTYVVRIKMIRYQKTNTKNTKMIILGDLQKQPKFDKYCWITGHTSALYN